ncbi:MSHA biogenesis protein MshI [Vibrio aquaticus]|uniref:MSHA biogenesis protein MshI n=1 Tax=Vibrio aquaticus TaxID=2496559 RepID=A0A3S0Q046_9VIBR|nr:MSHA biogenesis protein MshI [Vibrio aquaticus]RTZ14306.1 MSHA biogenesis protein MshI [Vibrio aquaticus]
MNIQSLIGKFKTNKQTAASLGVVVQPSALFFSATSGTELPQHVTFDNVSWQEALIKVLRENNVTDLSLNIVLHSNLYQTYQIEQPNLPDEELSSALPFLLKDLIAERVTDIVADSIALPMGNKRQVYVVQRALIKELYSALQKINIELNQVLVEDEVWGHSAGELANFLLLQRSKRGQFKVSAFVNSQCAFQRTIRGVTPPLTGVAASVLQLDGIALELQRSVDYLSSQLRGTSLHQMQVCCDEEDQQEIAQALSERLSVKVSALTESNQESGHVLAAVLGVMGEAQVNLFPADIKPKKNHFSLQNVVAGWAVVAVTLLLSAGYLHYQKSQLTEDLQLVRSQESEFRQQVASLNERLKEHKPTAAKVAAVARLKLEIEAKTNSLDAVGEFDESQQLGYSGIMRSLAELGRNDISLSSIHIDATRLDLQGLAREAKAIPNWVNQFKHELNLVGRTFEKLKIGRNEQDIIVFELKTKREKK